MFRGQVFSQPQGKMNYGLLASQTSEDNLLNDLNDYDYNVVREFCGSAS